MKRNTAPLLWEISKPGRRAITLPDLDVPAASLPTELLRTPGAQEGGRDTDGLFGPHGTLPEIGELDLVRHFTRLSQLNFSIDTNFYPLGSCTMKYNPKMNEAAAAHPGFASHHPYQPAESSTGTLGVMHRLQDALAAVSGFAAVSLQPAAGAQGEFSGVLMIRAYHGSRGDTARTRMLIPDSAHGTNPATVAMAGFKAVQIPSDAEGNVDLDALHAECDQTVAGLMITNPNTLGLFEAHLEEVIETVHACGGLVYGDGANLNAILGKLRPGDLGIDVMHFNLHKTFSTPHGGGGPGAGPVGCNEKLAPFLPGPVVRATAGSLAYVMPEHSIGRIKSFYGNFGMLLRAYVYIAVNGTAGLRRIAENAVLNANYLKELLSETYPVRYRRRCMHEFVCQPPEGVRTIDIAKRLLDYGFHAPTVYFPLIVKEALMVEPTETESRETIETFAETMIHVAREAERSPELLHDAPYTMPVGRLDEVSAAKRPVLRYCPG